jgi:pilus assembly protein CpaF
VIKGSDRVYIGDFIISIDDGTGAGAEPANAPPPPPPGPAPAPSAPPPPRPRPPQPGAAPAAPPPRRPPPPEPAPPPRRAAPEPRPAYMEEEDENLGAMEPERPVPPPRRSAPPVEDMAPPEAPPYADEEEAPPAPPPRHAPPTGQQRRPATRPIAQMERPPSGGDLADLATPVPQAAPEPAPAPRPAPAPARPAPRPAPAAAPPQAAAAPPKRTAPPVRGLDAKKLKIIELQREVHDRLIERMDLRRLEMDKLGAEELREKVERTIAEIVAQMEGQGQIPAFVNQDALIEDVLNEALGLGPLEEFLADPAITEIMVNHASQIYLEREGRLTLSEKTFSSDKAVLGVIERIVAPIGRRIDESSPLVDARLKDGSRVNAIIPPLALKGPCITIRKFKREMLGPEELVRYGTITPGMVAFLKSCILARRNTIIAGGTGSGKTTTLNILSNFIPEAERLLTIEDAAELQLHHEHWIQLESRPPNIEGKGQITIRELVKNSLRMRPDRIIVGECRGGEALDMLQAMNTGHDGSLTTIHANTPRDTLARLETMVLMSGMDLPIKAIREQVAAAINIIVQQSRFADGSRRITHISEITGMEGEIITMQDIFSFKQEGFDANNKVTGRFVPTGFIPKFYEDLRRRGIEVDMTIFRD